MTTTTQESLQRQSPIVTGEVMRQLIERGLIELPQYSSVRVPEPPSSSPNPTSTERSARALVSKEIMYGIFGLRENVKYS